MNWNLEYFFKSQNDFLNSITETKELINNIKNYQGKLNTEENLESYFTDLEFVLDKLYRIYQYASLSYTLNMKDTNLLQNIQKAQYLFYQLSQNTSFFEPEILKIGLDKIKTYKSKKIKEYTFPIEQIYHSKDHVLSEDKELLLTNFSNATNHSDVYDALSVADHKDKEVLLLNESKVKVSQGNWSSLIQNEKDPYNRKLIFETLYEEFDNHKNTYANIYYNIIKRNIAYAKSRNYNNVLESFLYNDKIPNSVYETLIDTARTNSDPLKKYIKLRKKILKLDEYRTYDRFLTLSQTNTKYSYNEAKDLFFDAISFMPEEFIDNAKIALEDGFVDVNIKEGKESGAFSSGLYNMHPFIKLNHDETLESCFTLAHEAGHSIHTLFSNKYQPMATSDYTIFVAEIASTFNEHLLLDVLLEKAKTKEEKIMLLDHALQSIASTYFRQALFANYEYEAHKIAENGEPITEETLSNIMIKLYKEYYDIDITKEKVKKYVWAYIPHLFHSPFYVYKYATSFTASLKIYSDIKNNVPNALNNYLNMLKSGGSDYSLNLVKKANVDLTKKETYLSVNERMYYLINELEKLID